MKLDSKNLEKRTYDHYIDFFKKEYDKSCYGSLSFISHLETIKGKVSEKLEEFKERTNLMRSACISTIRSFRDVKGDEFCKDDKLDTQNISNYSDLSDSILAVRAISVIREVNDYFWSNEAVKWKEKPDCKNYIQKNYNDLLEMLNEMHDREWEYPESLEDSLINFNTSYQYYLFANSLRLQQKAIQTITTGVLEYDYPSSLINIDGESLSIDTNLKNNGPGRNPGINEQDENQVETFKIVSQSIEIGPNEAICNKTKYWNELSEELKEHDIMIAGDTIRQNYAHLLPIEVIKQLNQLN